MLCVVKPMLARLIGMSAIDQRLMVIVLMLASMSALMTELIGLHALFGAFLAGVIIPQQERLRRAIADRIEDISMVLCFRCSSPLPVCVPRSDCLMI